MPILELLAIKGLAALGKGIIAAKATGPALAATKLSASTVGAAQTASVIAAASVVVGGVVWTCERIKLVTDGLDLLEQRNYGKASTKFARLLVSADIHVSMLPDVVHDFLVHSPVSSERVEWARDQISNLEGSIVKKAIAVD